MPSVYDEYGSGEKYDISVSTRPSTPLSPVGWFFLSVCCFLVLICFIRPIVAMCNCCSRSCRSIFYSITVCLDITYRNILYGCCKEPPHVKISANFITISVSTYKSSEISECNICLCNLNNSKVITLECGHNNFHKRCIIKWFSAQVKSGSHPSCPSCREFVTLYSFQKERRASPLHNYPYSSDSDYSDY
jgi:hypothetical protein